MSDQQTFEKHLQELDDVFGKLNKDFQTGPINKLNEWFEDLLDDLYAQEDSIERTVNTRFGYDEDSFDDEDVITQEPEPEEESVVFNEDFDDIEEDDAAGDDEDEETEADDDEEDGVTVDSEDDEDEETDEAADDYRNVNISIRLK